ncbi:MAG: 30S ribosomal protein S2 [Candidatus Shikimatogenerans bostrichidophilus]|nr:MAG: 30S ribosomal protein S2 [Candidatus Shikimatogenerans bostrichidophilus]
MKKKIFKIIKTLYKNKVNLGHASSLRNPKMADFILLKTKNFDIINPFKILKYKIRAQKFLEKCSSLGGSILFVGTKKQIKEIIKKYANKVNMPYINYKWPAGLLTNITNTRSTIQKKEDLKNQNKNLYKYLSKKEKVLIERKYKKINKKFGTIFKMKKLPMAIIIVDIKKEKIAFKEALKTFIYTIGIVDTDSDPDNIDYPIPANDDLSKSIEYILKGLTKYIKRGILYRKKRIKNYEEKNNKKDSKVTKIN